jgi:F0F1-type ATP synthase membrane subunit b/b'
MMRNRFLAILAVALIVLAGVAMAQPKRNVSAARHPHIAKAQQLSHEAWQQVLDAQKANEWDMGGHAQKAKELLDQANSELKLAAEAANAKK